MNMVGLSSALFAYPKQAAFGRVIPKNKIYEHGQVNTRLKTLFVEQVEQIVWQYKLAPETINLPAKPEVPEIQVFSIQLKTPELNLDVLRAIDAAVLFPIIFELNFDGRTQVMACYKQLKDLTTNSCAINDYFATVWLESDSEREAMPLALDMASLYEQLLQRLIPISARPQENLADLVARWQQIARKQREMDRVSKKLAKEKQFNRKVEINSSLRQLKAELESLTAR
ncbi:MAG: DUF4391 domain-containing protein [Thiotrichales bacterium]|nr:MAG: DUF4391 domain-containing protein [Thiotrichales bacterium]